MAHGDYMVGYLHETPPKDPAQLPAYLDRELRRISIAIEIMRNGLIFEKIHAEPSKKHDGMVKYADGTNWNPGSGAGFYYYKVTTWTFIA